MAFIATTDSVGDAFLKLKRQAADTRRFMMQSRPALLEECDSQIVLNLVQHCGIVLGLMSGWAATPGIAEYAKQQVSDPAYDIVAEFVAMRGALIDLRDFTANSFPKDANGFLLYHTLDANGRVQSRKFQASQLTGVVTRVDAVISSIA